MIHAKTGMSRREFSRLALAAGCAAGTLPAAAGPNAPYVRANTDWLAKCRYGIGVHWTAQTAPRSGKPLPFQEAVEKFNVKLFVEQVRAAGADYALFTTAHAMQKLPAPHPVIDRILPGRTCRRDLIAELSDALAAHGLPLIAYWNHSCNQQDDPPWRKAVGYDGPDKNVLAENLLEIVGWMGTRYGERIKAWWFDSPGALDPKGSSNGVTTDMGGFQFPWEKMTVAAKAGFARRLVTYNDGVDATYLYTKDQDYWAGEMTSLEHPAKSRRLANGLQWFSWLCLEDRGWVHFRQDAAVPPPLYGDDDVLAFIRACNANQAPVTFNLGIYQDGSLGETSLEQMKRISRRY